MNWKEFMRVFEDCELDGNKIIIKSQLHDVIKFVVENYTYDILKEIIAVDVQEGNTELIYHMYSTADEEDLFLSITVKDEAESIVDIFKSAQADENEIFDLFGVKFLGNENLKRLYMPEDWKGFPLRKDYVQDDTRLAWNDDEKA
mgnify:CR=1 FL=1